MFIFLLLPFLLILIMSLRSFREDKEKYGLAIFLAVLFISFILAGEFLGKPETVYTQPMLNQCIEY